MPPTTARALGLLLLVVVLVATGGRAAPQQPRGAGRDYPVQPVPFTAVHLDDQFWAPKIETNRLVSIPFAFQQCELSGRVDNFVRAETNRMFAALSAQAGSTSWRTTVMPAPSMISQ